MPSKIASGLIAAAALGLASGAYAQAGSSQNPFVPSLNTDDGQGQSCNQATADGGMLAEQVTAPSDAQADSQFTDVPAPDTYRDATPTPESAYRDQRCKVLDYIEKPLLQQEWNSIPPPPSPVIPPAPLTSANDIDKSATKRGAGWCYYVNDADKTAFYSAVYQGVPSRMALDPVVWEKTLQAMSLDFEKAVQRQYPSEQGWSQCTFNQWDSDYVQAGEEKSNEFNRILQNYKVVTTNWQPIITSTQ